LPSRTDLTTGETEQVLVPCEHTLASVCPACAERARNLRAAQCREGWHLDREPDLEPDPATDGLRPGACKGKAHRREYLGYAGRRVLTSRKWSGKTLADHRADRENWLVEMLGLPATDPARYSWQLVGARRPGLHATGQRLLHVVADRMHWLQALDQARRRAQGQPDDLSATGRAA
jgi:Replication initiator protein, pSAM2